MNLMKIRHVLRLSRQFAIRADAVIAEADKDETSSSARKPPAPFAAPAWN
jgi:hypothetical protein